MPHNRHPGLSCAARTALAVSVALSTVVLTGCPPVAPPATRPAGVAEQSVPIFGSEPVSSGVFVSLHASTPLTGQALTRALTPRAAIREAVAVASPTTAPSPATTAANASPPPLAIKYYLQGREKFLDGANTEAMGFLEKALQLDPNAFTVLRLMGRVCFASSQLARGSLYLQRAQQSHPADVEVNYLLGRYWLERKDSDRAIYYLMQADDSPERSAASPQMPLVSFYLARAFQAAGYHQAAAREYEKFLEAVALPVPEYRYDQELSYLMQEQWATHLSIGENDALIGDYAHALVAYEKAAAENPLEIYTASRLVNAAFHLGKFDEANGAALDSVLHTQGAPAALELIAWVYRAQGRENALVPELRSRLKIHEDQDQGDLIILTAALDALGQKQQAFDMLNRYLIKNPYDQIILDRLLKRVDSPERFAAGLAATANALAAFPDGHDDFLKVFLPTTQVPAIGATHAVDGLASGAAAYAKYLLALTAEAQHAEPAVIDADFSESVRLKPEFLPAREAYVTWLLGQEKFAQASALIQQTIDTQHASAKTWRLLVASEAAQQRLLHALQLAQEARGKYPNDPETWLQLASIYRMRGQNAEADAELHTLVETFPKFEPGYKALISGLIARGQDTQSAAAPGGSLTAVAEVLAKMNRELPESVYAQVSSATLYARAGRLEEAETMLRRLLTASPNDAEILIPLAEIRQVLGHPEDGIAILSDSLKAHPQMRVAEALVDLYRGQGKPADAAALAQHLVTDHPESEGYALLQASIPAAEKQYDAAITLLQSAAHRFPRSQEVAITLANVQEVDGKTEEAVRTLRTFIHDNGETPERLYQLSHLYSAADQDDESVAALQQVLSLMPDHTGANNDLGFFWTDAGIHLEDAERMIKKAVDNEPNNSAFLDSMGWVEYKQGRFGQAIALFERAVAQPDGMEAEVVQHLGDALYRAGRKGEALERWTQAASLLTIEVGPASKSREKLKGYLAQVLAAARAGRDPVLTPTAQREKPQSAGPASLPKTTSN